MNEFILQKENFKINFTYTENSLWISDGNFYSIQIKSSPLFYGVIKDLQTNELQEFDSQIKNYIDTVIEQIDIKTQLN